jgi:hypothetical protein
MSLVESLIGPSMPGSMELEHSLTKGNSEWEQRSWFVTNVIDNGIILQCPSIRSRETITSGRNLPCLSPTYNIQVEYTHLPL